MTYAATFKFFSKSAVNVHSPITDSVFKHTTTTLYQFNYTEKVSYVNLLNRRCIYILDYVTC